MLVYNHLDDEPETPRQKWRTIIIIAIIVIIAFVLSKSIN